MNKAAKIENVIQTSIINNKLSRIPTSRHVTAAKRCNYSRTRNSKMICQSVKFTYIIMKNSGDWTLAH